MRLGMAERFLQSLQNDLSSFFFASWQNGKEGRREGQGTRRQGGRPLLEHTQHNVVYLFLQSAFLFFQRSVL